MSEMSIRQAIESTGLSRQWLYQLIIAGRVRSRKIATLRGPGYELRIDTASLRAYVKSRRNKE